MADHNDVGPGFERGDVGFELDAAALFLVKRNVSINDGHLLLGQGNGALRRDREGALGYDGEKGLAVWTVEGNRLDFERGLVVNVHGSSPFADKGSSHPVRELAVAPTLTYTGRPTQVRLRRRRYLTIH